MIARISATIFVLCLAIGALSLFLEVKRDKSSKIGVAAFVVTMMITPIAAIIGILAAIWGV